MQKYFLHTNFSFLFYTSAGQRPNKNEVNSYSGTGAGSGHKASSNSPAFWLKRITRNVDGVVGVEVGGNLTAALTSYDPDSDPVTVSRAKRR